MPSGSNRRKAVKKKKDRQSINNLNPSARSLGGDDLNRPQRKESYSGEVITSPTSQDRPENLDQLTDGEKEEYYIGDKISDPHPEAGLQADEGIEKVGNVSVESQVKIEERTNKENETTYYEKISRNDAEEDKQNGVKDSLAEEDVSLVDSVKEGSEIMPTESDKHSGISEEICSSSGTEDQPCDIKDTQAEEDILPVDSVKGEFSFVPIELKNEINPNERNGKCENEEIGSRNSVENQLHIVRARQTEENVFHFDSAINTLSGGREEVYSSTMRELGDLGTENSPLVVKEKTLVWTDKEEGTSLPSDFLVEHVTGKTEKRKTIAMDEKVDVFASFATKEVDVFLKHNTSSVTTSDSKEFVGDSTSITSADNGTEFGANEPTILGAPRTLQTTSWKSCCGLFEAFKIFGR